MTRRWLMIAFALSVALNLFFLGMTVAHFWQHRQWRMQRWGDPALSMAGGSGEGAQKEGRRGSWRRGNPFAWLSEQERNELRPQRRALFDARRDAEQVLVTEPFDAEKLRGALAGVRARTGEVQSAMHERLLQHAQTLGLDERRKLADMSWGTPGEHARRPPRLRERRPEGAAQ